MDALSVVEREVNEVLSSFRRCREFCSHRIDQIIEYAEETQQILNQLSKGLYTNSRRSVIGLAHLRPTQADKHLSFPNFENKADMEERGALDDPANTGHTQASIIDGKTGVIQMNAASITKSHRELHVPVTKIGKSIDKNFNSDFTIRIGDPSHFQKPENKQLLNNAIVHHLLRQGMAEVAEAFIKEAKLSIDQDELLEFREIALILSAIKRRDLGPALKWAVKNRLRLKQTGSSLEFKIHRINILELYKHGLDKQHEIIQYARIYLHHLHTMYDLEIQHLMGGIIYLKTGIENSPYKSFLEPINYSEIEEIFINDACAVLRLSARSPISVAVDAGCIALPALLEINQSLAKQGVQNVWQLRDELPIEIPLGRNLQFHSTFSCPILKQQSTEGNPPMRLVCGHVISRDALQKLSNSSTGNKLKCPYCPIEQVLSDAVQIYF